MGRSRPPQTGHAAPPNFDGSRCRDSCWRAGRELGIVHSGASRKENGGRTPDPKATGADGDPRGSRLPPGQVSGWSWWLKSDLSPRKPFHFPAQPSTRNKRHWVASPWSISSRPARRQAGPDKPEVRNRCNHENRKSHLDVRSQPIEDPCRPDGGTFQPKLTPKSRQNS